MYEIHKLHRLKVFSDLHGYINEKTTYSRELDEGYEPTEKIEDKEMFHRMDAERYILGDFTPEMAKSDQGCQTYH